MAVSLTDVRWSHDVDRKQPSYYFTIKEMRRKENAPKRYSKRGWFLPPKALGHNVVESIEHFHHLAGLTTVTTSIPNEAETHGTYSIYVYNATIWTVNYDAINRPVHDGDDRSESSGCSLDDDDSSDVQQESTPFDYPPDIQMDEDSPYQDDWVSMSFNHHDNHVSYVSRRMQNWRLCVKRSDQDWATLILPDPYMAQHTTDNPHHGGLIGDLPLLIGLVALAVEVNDVSTALPEVMSERWVFDHMDPTKRTDGCEWITSK